MPEHALHINALRFGHDRSMVLDDLSLTLPPAQFHVIVGPNGCGKSTLLDLVAGYRCALSGNIALNGLPTESLCAKERARQLAYMPQNERSGFAYSVRETVMMGRHPHIPRFAAPGDEDRRIVEEALESLDLRELSDRPVTELSGGERQRTALARTLAQDAPLMLLDEPTASMDPKHSLAVMTLLAERCHQGRTVIAVLHDLNLAAAFADTVTILHEGRAAVSGSVQEALSPEVIGRAFGVEARVDADPFTGRPRIGLRSRS